MLHVEELPMAASRCLAYQMMLDAGPVVPDAHGAFVITESAAATYALRHPELFSSLPHPTRSAVLSRSFRSRLIRPSTPGTASCCTVLQRQGPRAGCRLSATSQAELIDDIADPRNCDLVTTLRSRYPPRSSYPGSGCRCRTAIG
jgi:hypothetical protein